ncbi:MAG: hypothetical protein CME26_10100 [Gemmatimonadetes bacterium]|nr:hypothetical protein [Gemmatimonadota bacterium]
MVQAKMLFRQCEDILLPLKDELEIEAISSRRSNRLSLYLKPANESTLTTDEIKKRVAALLPKDLPGVRFKSGRRRGSSATGVGVELKDRDPQVLAMLDEDIQLKMQDLDGVHDVETSLESGTEEIRVSLNRERAQRLGLTPRGIATTVATALGSRGNSKFKPADGEIDISVQLKEEDRATLAQLMNAQFESDQGELISFSSLANFGYAKGPNTIKRDDRMSTVSVFANTEEWPRFRIGSEMMPRMQNAPLPKGYTWQMDRSFRWMQQEQSEGHFTMIFAAILIYIIMASLFESYIHGYVHDRGRLRWGRSRVVHIQHHDGQQRFLRPPDPVRHRCEQRDRLCRPHQPLPQGGLPQARSHRSRWPGPVASHSDDCYDNDPRSRPPRRADDLWNGRKKRAPVEAHWPGRHMRTLRVERSDVDSDADRLLVDGRPECVGQASRCRITDRTPDSLIPKLDHHR